METRYKSRILNRCSGPVIDGQAQMETDKISLTNGHGKLEFTKQNMKSEYSLDAIADDIVRKTGA